jgi:urease accessory protein
MKAPWRIGDVPLARPSCHNDGAAVKSENADETLSMLRIAQIKRAGEWNPGTAADRVVLDAGERNRRRIVLRGEKGTEFLLDFEKPVALRDGDGLLLDDGAMVLVTGAPEPLIEISAHSALDTVRLAWHLGNRHTDVQIVGAKIRIRRDHVLEEMLRGLGAHLAPLAAAFDPEAGAPHERGHGHGG